MVVGSYGRHSAGAVLGQLQGKHLEAAIIGGMATGSWLCRAHAGTTQFVHSGVVGLILATMPGIRLWSSSTRRRSSVLYLSR